MDLIICDVIAADIITAFTDTFKSIYDIFSTIYDICDSSIFDIINVDYLVS